MIKIPYVPRCIHVCSVRDVLRLLGNTITEDARCVIRLEDTSWKEQQPIQFKSGELKNNVRILND